MALQLAEQLASGVAVQYHRIVAMNINYDSLVADVIIGSYVSAAARTSGKAPVATKRLLVKLTGAAVDPRAEVYTFLTQAAPAPVTKPDPANPGKTITTIGSPAVTGFAGATSV